MDGHTLAVGGPYDAGGMGAMWIFVSNGSTYQQLGSKLVGSGASGFSKSGFGASVSLSSDGRILAVGGPADDSLLGGTWIFVFDGTTYQQLGAKLVGSGSVGTDVYQGKIIQQAYHLVYVIIISRCLID